MRFHEGQAVEFRGLPGRIGYIQGWVEGYGDGIPPQEGIFYEVVFADDLEDPSTKFHFGHLFAAEDLTDATEADRERKRRAAERKQKTINDRQNNTVRGITHG